MEAGCVGKRLLRRDSLRPLSRTRGVTSNGVRVEFDSIAFAKQWNPALDEATLGTAASLAQHLRQVTDGGVLRSVGAEGDPARCVHYNFSRSAVNRNAVEPDVRLVRRYPLRWRSRLPSSRRETPSSLRRFTCSYPPARSSFLSWATSSRKTESERGCQESMTQHNSAVMAVLLFVLGAMMIGKGIAAA